MSQKSTERVKSSTIEAEIDLSLVGFDKFLLFLRRKFPDDSAGHNISQIASILKDDEETQRIAKALYKIQLEERVKIEPLWKAILKLAEERRKAEEALLNTIKTKPAYRHPNARGEDSFKTY